MTYSRDVQEASIQPAGHSLTERRPAIDLARTAALAMVVLGHLSLAVIDRGPDDTLRGTNLLSLYPRWAWLTVIAPMPVFFAAAGWANTTATVRSSAPRLRAMVGVAAVVVSVWSLAAMAALLSGGGDGGGGGGGGVVVDGARLATQPLWFIGAYVPLAAVGGRLAQLAARPALAVGTCLAVLAGLDLARFSFDAPRAIGWPGFAAAWAVPWLVGAWWRVARASPRFNERRTGALLALAAIITAATLVRFAGYNAALIDAVKGQRSNTTPPTLYTAVVALAQVGVLMVVASFLDRIGARLRHLLSRAGQAAVGVYVWHLTAVALCAAVLAAGFGAPTRFSVAWWLSRPLWFGAVLVITTGLVAATNTARRRLVKRTRSSATQGRFAELRQPFGVALSTAGAAIVGLIGPRTLPAAITATVCFVAGWWLLGSSITSQPQASSE